MFNKKVTVCLLLFICTFIVLNLLPKCIPYGLRLNTSGSLPYWAFVSKDSFSLERGDYVAFKHPLNEMRLAKRVVGFPGDPIEKVGEYIFCNGFNCGIAVHVTPSGKRVTPVSEKFVPEGHYFVHASNPDSFDSRYQEFGFVKIDNVEEQLWPIF